tara:strand:- start:402 stop:1181 length:780 start_codon:yes stop_codon:yes gene_type:complete
MINKISSKDNSLFKYAKKLKQKANFRKKEKKFIVEGQKEIDLCIKSNFKIDMIFISNKKKYTKIDKLNIKTHEIDDYLVKKIIYRESEGIFAIVNYKYFDIEKIRLNDDELFLILENPEKPGNIGAIMRTFEASGFKNIVLSNSKIEIFNPNTIRASLGSIFSLNIFQTKTDEIINFLDKNNFRIYGSFIKSNTDYKKINFKKRCAIVMGPEKSSISNKFINKSHELLSIPLHGKVDSLNLSVATAIILYEALNQRKFS